MKQLKKFIIKLFYQKNIIFIIIFNLFNLNKTYN